MCLLRGRFGHVHMLRCMEQDMAGKVLRKALVHIGAIDLDSIKRTKSFEDSMENGSNATYIENLHKRWTKSPSSVEKSWDAYFRHKSGTSSSSSVRKNRQSNPATSTGPGSAGGSAVPPDANWSNIDDHLVVQAIIRSYQTRGHLAANLDPLGIVGPLGNDASKKTDGAREVLRQNFYYTFNDLNATFKLPSTTMIGGDEKFLPLREILKRLEETYCGHIGVEYMMITSFTKCTWLRKHFETPGVINFSPEEKKIILERLTRSTGFENFLAKKFSSEKRFGLEGCDIMIPVMKEIIDNSTNNGVESVYIGMAHRGRLNTLANICRTPLVQLLSQFKEIKARDWGSGDVKYHLGLFTERMNRQTQKPVRIIVVANPSHLEFVNPVVLGKARAEMFERGDRYGDKVLPILIHGDASFSGQGVVYEALHLSDLPAYTTHGTIHVVVNNQVGFTTDPRFSRSSRYCTDVARVVNSPIFHVNADDPEACIHCARVAAKWRAKYHKDVVIDIVGYRRNGHNEADEPMFTQPLMYQKIRKQRTCMDLYADKLIKEGIVTIEEYKAMISKYDAICNKAFEESKKVTTFKNSQWLDSPWTSFFQGRDRLLDCPTGVNIKVLQHIGRLYSSLPPEDHNFVVHRGLKRILGLRMKMVEDCVADWSLGEAFAIGSLVKDKVHVRLSGQDVERGTFSHRHHVLHHQTKDRVSYNSLSNLYPDQSTYHVSNSSLSECAVLGFDLGYSLNNPQYLVIWEAQFGDFANTAQPIIDQFLCSGETKWIRQCGLVVFLPHSMEGMGPEHSSGRLERFLQLSDDDPDTVPTLCDEVFGIRQLNNINWIVTNLTTPANLFHALRRQIKLAFRKPLINFSPKSLLRHPLARSHFKDFDECSAFHRLIPETGKACENPECVKQLIFCTGKVYYDLLKEREMREKEDSVGLVRVEQICPFPYDLAAKEIEKYKKAELIWAQEEHKNQGAWNYVQQRFGSLLRKIEECRSITYHGRAPNSASSTGNKMQHYKEYNEFINCLLGELTEENKKRLKEIAKKKAAAAKAARKPAKPTDPKAAGPDNPKTGRKKAKASANELAKARDGQPLKSAKAPPAKDLHKKVKAAKALPDEEIDELFPKSISPSPAKVVHKRAKPSKPSPYDEIEEIFPKSVASPTIKDARKRVRPPKLGDEKSDELFPKGIKTQTPIKMKSSKALKDAGEFYQDWRNSPRVLRKRSQSPTANPDVDKRNKGQKNTSDDTKDFSRKNKFDDSDDGP